MAFYNDNSYESSKKQILNMLMQINSMHMYTEKDFYAIQKVVEEKYEK